MLMIVKFIYCFTGQKISGYGHFETCGSAQNAEHVADRGRAMLEGRPVAAEAIRINELMEQTVHGVQLKLRACPRCRQRNLKEARNNHMKCWSCKADFCYTCVKLMGNPVFAHFKGSGACQQHSDDWSVTVDAMEVLINYCMNSFPQVDQFLRIQISFYFLCVSYWSICSETKSNWLI
jgi:hypothetical protein